MEITNSSQELVQYGGNCDITSDDVAEYTMIEGGIIDFYIKLLSLSVN